MLLSCSVSGQGSVKEIATIWQTPWESTEIAPGIVWKSYHYDSLFGGPQSVNVISWDLKDSTYTLDFVVSDSVLRKTSVFASAKEAIAAVNGTFFDMKAGGSVCYLKYEDSVRYTIKETKEYIQEAGIAIDHTGMPHIVLRPGKSWSSLKYPSIMASGPLIILDGISRPFKQEKFNTNRHPRTAIGITEKQELLMVTVDGRNAKAIGMSMGELKNLMLGLKCHSALNLDGGGSTTMWLEREFGVVNFPSDNKQYDHLGERPVANVVIIRARE